MSNKKIPLYETVIRAVKIEMNKNSFVRDKSIISALKDSQSKYAKYWRFTGNFPSDDDAASILSDAVNDREKELETNKKVDRDKIEREISIIQQFIPKDFEYKSIDLDSLKNSETNVKWPLYHNPNNIIITDKKQFKML